jgi:oligoribonuclease NrnB/cAMP/cGMP phosphodiesterase (DHH superfamily)
MVGPLVIPKPHEVDLVIYHDHCMDGFGAAYAAWRALGDSVSYLPAKYGDLPPDVSGKNVLIVDFSYRKDVLLRMSESARSILVLDHHKSAQEDLQGLDFAQFDSSCSGAMLAWSFFHPDEHPPDLIRYIQDRDLWQWRLPESREFSMGLMGVPFNFRAYDAFTQAGAVKSAISTGRAIVGYIDREIAKLCKHAAQRRLRVDPSLTCGVVNTSSWVSELGAKICETHDVAVVWYLDHDKRQWRVSLRSRKGVDVTGIARHYGGGGHAQAAGFSLGWDEHIEGIFLDETDVGPDVDERLQDDRPEVA